MTRERDPEMALPLEVLGGFFGLLGVEWIYAGRPGGGILLLVGTWLLDWIVGLMLTVGTLGAWCCVWPAQNLLFGALSGDLVYRWLEEDRLSEPSRVQALPS